MLANLPAAAGVDALTDDEAKADGYRYLARAAAYYLVDALTSSDPHEPAFVRMGDRLYRAMAPNPDNICRSAGIDAAGTYRITGHMHSCEDLIVSVTAGRYHDGTYRVLWEATAEQLGIRAGQPFTLTLSETPEVPAPNGVVALDAGAERLIIREYYFSGGAAMPADFVIERIDRSGEPAPTWSADDLAERLTAATHDIAASVQRARQEAEAAAAQPANVVNEPTPVYGGSGLIRYGNVMVELADDEAFLLEFEAPAATYWAMQLVTPLWGETIDDGGRTSSLNQATARVDEDRQVRVVVSSRDPGVENWLDTAGHRRVRLLYRWIDAANAPVPVGRVLPVTDVASDLPAPVLVSPDARRDQIAARRAHLAWRTRT